MTYNNALVSVIIPVFNNERYIAQTIESVLMQTYREFEIIIINDCSQDNTDNIVRKYVKENSNIIYRSLNTNSGSAVARNKAIDIANGRFISFLDSDDLWYPEKMEMQLRMMKQKEAPFSFTSIEIINENGKLLKQNRDVLKKVGYQLLLKNTMIATSTVIIDRNKVNDFRMPLIRSGQDYATWLLLLRNGEKAYGLNKALVKYRKRKGSLSSKKYTNFKKVWKIQVFNENIDPFIAMINTLFYTFNAFKKHYL